MLPSRDDLPLSLHSAAQVRDLDARLIAAGTPGFELMRRAAHATWRALRRRWPEAGSLSVLAGHGNNAGDGYLIAALAQRAGWRVKVLAVGASDALTGDAALARDEAIAAGITIQLWSECATLDGVAVDALLGTGLSGAVREPYAQAIRLLNSSALPVLAVDIPSGLCADTGRVQGVAVRADLTVTFIGLKIGLFTADAPNLVGELVFDDLQADPALLAVTPRVAERMAVGGLQRLAPRPRTAHKGQFGHLLVVGGDRGLGGAALLSAESALRSGAGLVSLATRPEHVPAALARCPELMSAGVSSANQLLALASKADVLVVGPGLGQGAWGRSLLSVVAGLEVPQVWDADALNLLAVGQARLPVGAVITPHPGEASRLLGVPTADVQADRPRTALALAQKFDAVVLLKGAGSLVAAPDGRLALCDRGHPVMAGAGLGDVLAGLIGALLAQGMDGYAATCLAVWLHANAGESLARAGRGLAASDLIPTIRQLLEEFAPCLK
ncbi:bifunctional ADP-dependent NAD(P)H-hydrate dehydratase/NAD(P)H-hydrate epimerase [Metapseudomonas resinovorans]|uniref:bifunctional ADP-dependent NAD(P)H-hydrate dehydratase/NAD(P)H-hydrate epimerase n=1 Tax=Metapseudomonas resinovorans TaxID=53412 RepID=UPI00040F852E|nr:bifunctional ADP-dependent NAD(P)H-hydrate dehydratase/NAD(P)H-hydrate epimerase [Pseudomonas resinovorans]